MADVRQDVNLLLTLDPPEIEVYLPLPRLTKIVIAWVALLFVVTGLGLWSMFTSSSELKQENKKRNQLAAQVKQYKTMQPRSVDSNLEKRVQKLAEDISSKSKLIELLNSEEVTNVNGYSAYMEAMAQGIPKNVWLTEFIIGDQGIFLKGKTTSATLVADFASALHKTKPFAKARFKHMDIDRDLKTKDIVFVLATKRDIKEDK